MKIMQITVAVLLGSVLAQHSVAQAPRMPVKTPAPTKPSEMTKQPERPDTAFLLPAVQPQSQDSLHPGDKLRLKIWREPDFSGEYTVGTDGAAVLPRLGRVEVVKMSIYDLEKSLTRAYNVYLTNPTVEVEPLRRIIVLGAVKAPGSYVVEPTSTVADVLSMAGGPTPDANMAAVEVRRAPRSLKGSLTQTASFATMPVRSGDQIYIPERKLIQRNSWMITAAVSLVSTALILVTR